MSNGPNINDVLSSPTRLTEQSQNLLTKLFRQVLVELNIGAKTFEPLVKRYLRDPHSGIADDPTARNNHRGNLMKELASNDMTWRIFLKALRVIGVSEFELALSIKRRSGGQDVITKHIIWSRNEISYEEPREDLSNANIITQFEHQALQEQQARNTLTLEKPDSNRAVKLPEGVVLPSGI